MMSAFICILLMIAFATGDNICYNTTIVETLCISSLPHRVIWSGIEDGVCIAVTSKEQQLSKPKESVGAGHSTNKVLAGEHSQVAVEGVNALGKLETATMEIMWRLKTATVADVYREFRMRDSKRGVSIDDEVKYTSVLTTLSRLSKKGFLKQDRSTPAYTYTIVKEPAQIAEEQVAKVLKAMIDQVGEGVVRNSIERVLPKLRA